MIGKERRTLTQGGASGERSSSLRWNHEACAWLSRRTSGTPRSRWGKTSPFFISWTLNCELEREWQEIEMRTHSLQQLRIYLVWGDKGFFSFLWEEGIDEEDGKQKIIRSEQRLQRENLNILDLICTIFDSNPTVQSENAVCCMCVNPCSE